MALVDVSLPVRVGRPPEDVRRFLRDAEARIEAFTESSRQHPIPAFVPSDFLAAYWALVALDEQRLATGSLFCEWGSGFGVVTCLASRLEFESYGIEIERELVAEAERLASDYEMSATFVQGNFVPNGADLLAATPGELSWLSVEGSDAYEELGLALDDFDVIYAYPWPGEDDVLGHLFNAYAAEGALLVTYDGIDELRVRRRVKRHRSR